MTLRQLHCQQMFSLARAEELGTWKRVREKEKWMLPNYYIHEYLLFERHQERQREMAELRLVAGLRRHHFSLARRLAGKLGVLLVMLGTRLWRLELSGKQAVSDQGNVQETKTGRAFTTSSPYSGVRKS